MAIRRKKGERASMTTGRKEGERERRDKEGRKRKIIRAKKTGRAD